MAFYVLSSFPQSLKKISAQENQEVPRGILNTGWMFLGIGEGQQCLESNRNNAPRAVAVSENTDGKSVQFSG